MKKIGSLLCSLVVFFLALFLNCKQFYLVTDDIGRHIKNGEIILQTGKIIKTNFYSYTHPDFPTVTHHWGSGIAYYLTYTLGGFPGLSLFQAFIYALTVCLMYFIVKKITSPSIAFLSVLVGMPLISSRNGIRPESFSYFFCIIFFSLLYHMKCRRISPKIVITLLTFFQLIWVNMHIFFIFGIFLVFTFFIDALITAPKLKLRGLKALGFSDWKSKELSESELKSCRSGDLRFPPRFDKPRIPREGGLTKLKTSQPFLYALCFVLLASLVNPYGLWGILQPFFIFKNYGYMVAENQSVFFMQKLYPQSLYTYAEILSVCMCIGILLLFVRKKWKQYFFIIVPSLCFLVIGLLAIRNLPLLGLFSIPLLGISLFVILKKYKKKGIVIFSLSIIILALLIYFWKNLFPSYQKHFRVGVAPNDSRSFEFFQKNNLKGPIFNNYDVGNYLIFHLFPNERVFVDNRPEAYPSEFFTDEYVPSQENEDAWAILEAKYHFNCIYFYRLDQTPWAQPFLIRRLQDPSWAPVYADESTLILVKNILKNAHIIQNYQLPSNIFRITQ